MYGSCAYGPNSSLDTEGSIVSDMLWGHVLVYSIALVIVVAHHYMRVMSPHSQGVVMLGCSCSGVSHASLGSILPQQSSPQPDSQHPGGQLQQCLLQTLQNV